MVDLRVANEALDNDIGVWNAASESLSTGATNADAQTLGAGVFPINIPIDMLSKYQALQEKVATLFDQGAKETQGISETLVYVRSTINSTDASVADDLNGLWDY
ncbi:hypothetical protein GCM10023340_21660 [Nocardioides marinquilinus]|uniref:WXG100 family type VII secretion target n=1 Tax=Nocardioides marinquilinus TaxID=1210400 RepID=A0ABP9PMH7_9ACTN